MSFSRVGTHTENRRATHKTIDNHRSGAKSEQPNLILMSYYALEQTAGLKSFAHENQSDTVERNYQFSFSLHQR
jgi:hypothetical protein